MKNFKSMFVKVNRCFHDENGAQIVEYVMLILFVMVASTGAFAALNKAIANNLHVAINALEGQTNTALTRISIARGENDIAMTKANALRKNFVNEVK